MEILFNYAMWNAPLLLVMAGLVWLSMKVLYKILKLKSKKFYNVLYFNLFSSLYLGIFLWWLLFKSDAELGVLFFAPTAFVFVGNILLVIVLGFITIIRFSFKNFKAWFIKNYEK